MTTRSDPGSRPDSDRIIPTDDRRAVGVGHEAVEGVDEGVERSVMIEMIRFDVGHDAAPPRGREERRVALVRLEYEPVAVGPARARLERSDHSPDDEAGVQPCGVQRDGEERRGRRLAVCPRHRKGRSQRADRSQQIETMVDRQSSSACLDQLGVVITHRGGDADDLGVSEM